MNVVMDYQHHTTSNQATAEWSALWWGVYRNRYGPWLVREVLRRHRR